jgi:hypothetical protein
MGGLGGYSTATIISDSEADAAKRVFGGRYMDILTFAPAGEKQVLDVPAFHTICILY